MKSIFWILFAVLFFTLCGTALADDDLWTALATRKDVEIITHDGLRTAKFSSGVVISELKGGGTLSVDNSQHGAVMCAWEIYVEMNNWLDACSPHDDAEFKKTLSDSIERINNFIVVNSLSHQSKEEMEDQIKKKVFSMKERFSKLTDEEHQKQCASADFVKMINSMKSIPPEKFKSNIDDLLSVPRPPVLNPCL